MSSMLCNSLDLVRLAAKPSKFASKKKKISDLKAAGKTESELSVQWLGTGVSDDEELESDNDSTSSNEDDRDDWVRDELKKLGWIEEQNSQKMYNDNYGKTT